jgi:hypothetical protein
MRAAAEKVGVGAAVVSGMDAPPVVEPSEYVFDLVALLVDGGVIGDGTFEAMRSARPCLARAARNRSAS